MSSRNPVITGTGVISAAGSNRREVWEALRKGKSGLGPLTLFASARYGSHLVGQVREDVDRLAQGVRGSRSDKLGWLAAQEALEQAGLGRHTKDTKIAPERRGTGIGKQAVKKAIDEHPDWVFVARIKRTNNASIKIAEHAGLRFQREENEVLLFSTYSDS